MHVCIYIYIYIYTYKCIDTASAFEIWHRDLIFDYQRVWEGWVVVSPFFKVLQFDILAKFW